MPEITEEIGTAGLRSYSGVVREEYDYKLAGAQGRRVYRAMQDDPVVGAMLYAIDRLIRQVQWKVEAGADEEAALFIEEARTDMSQTWADLISEILSMIPYGWSYFEIVYKVRSGNTDDGSTRSRHRDGRIGWRKWALRSQDSLSRWQLDGGGGVQAMVQRTSSGREAVIPIQKALHFRTSAFKSNPEGRSLLRSAYRPYYFRTNIENIEGIGIERDLAGLPVAEVPAKWLSKNAEEWEKKLAEQMFEMVKNVRRNEQEGLVLPLVYDKETKLPLVKFSLLASSSRRQFSTSDVIQRKNVEMLMSVLADFLMLGHQQVGSYALGGTKAEMFARSLNSFVEGICDVINRFAIIRLLELNGMNTDDPPRLSAEPLDEVSLDDLISLVKDAGVKLDLETENVLRKRGGLPERVEEETTDDDNQTGASQGNATPPGTDQTGNAGGAEPSPGGDA